MPLVFAALLLGYPADEPVRLTVHPAAAPVPALKYQLLPEVRELNAGNPVQDIYLREVRGNSNQFRGIAVKALADPATGCAI